MKAIELLLVHDYVSGEEINIIFSYDESCYNYEEERLTFLHEEFKKKYPGATISDFSVISSHTISGQECFEQNYPVFVSRYCFDSAGNLYTVVDGYFINGIVFIDNDSKYEYYLSGRYDSTYEEPDGIEFVSNGETVYYEEGEGYYFTI